MGYFQDCREGWTAPESGEHEAMDAVGLDPDCTEDRELWRHCKACGTCHVCKEAREVQDDAKKGN